MLKRKFYLLFLVIFLVILTVGCGANTDVNNNELDQNTNDVGNDNNNNDNNNTTVDNDNDDEFPGWMTVEAASALPDSWMAYPGSMVSADWYEDGLSDYPAWMLVAPPGATREGVIQYYEQLADERNDFEVVQVHYGITGDWLWNGYELLIETDYYYDNPDWIQINFVFQQALD